MGAASCPCLTLFAIPVHFREISLVGMRSCLARLHARLQDRAVRDCRCLIFVAFDSSINFLEVGALSCQFSPRFFCPARFLAVWFVGMTSCLACMQGQLQDRIARGYGCLLANFIASQLNFLKVKTFVARFARFVFFFPIRLFPSFVGMTLCLAFLQDQLEDQVVRRLSSDRLLEFQS